MSGTAEASGTPETFSAYWCPQCQQVVEDWVTVYECGSCGERSDERRCDTCHRFKARDWEGDGCPECFTLLEEVTAVVDTDGAWIPASEYDPGGSRAERRAAQAAAGAAAREDRRSREIGLLMAGSEELRWAEVPAGARVLLDRHQRQPRSPEEIETLDQPVVLHAVTDGGATTALLTIHGARSLLVRAYAAEDRVWVLRQRATAPSEVRAFAPPGELPQLSSSSPGSRVRVHLMANGERSGTGFLVGDVEEGNRISSLCCFHTAPLARSAVAPLRIAAARLAELTGEELGDVVAAPLGRGEGFVVEPYPTFEAELTVGADRYSGPLVNVRAEGLNTSLRSARELMALALAVEEHGERLPGGARYGDEGGS